MSMLTSLSVNGIRPHCVRREAHLLVILRDIFNPSPSHLLLSPSASGSYIMQNWILSSIARADPSGDHWVSCAAKSVPSSLSTRHQAGEENVRLGIPIPSTIPPFTSSPSSTHPPSPSQTYTAPTRVVIATLWPLGHHRTLFTGLEKMRLARWEIGEGRKVWM